MYDGTMNWNDVWMLAAWWVMKNSEKKAGRQSGFWSGSLPPGWFLPLAVILLSLCLSGVGTLVNLFEFRCPKMCVNLGRRQ